jgi:hypothetical protein
MHGTRSKACRMQHANAGTASLTYSRYIQYPHSSMHTSASGQNCNYSKWYLHLHGKPGINPFSNRMKLEDFFNHHYYTRHDKRGRRFGLLSCLLFFFWRCLPVFDSRWRTGKRNPREKVKKLRGWTDGCCETGVDVSVRVCSVVGQLEGWLVVVAGMKRWGTDSGGLCICRHLGRSTGCVTWV